jgi:hypothetical protein
MVRRQTQKGSGIFNRVRSFFRGSKVAPEPVRQTRRINIKNEAYLDALRRDYVFFYHKLKGLEPPKEQRFVTPEQENEVKQTLLRAKQDGMEEDAIVTNIFHANPVQFQKELSDWEEYRPDRFLNKGTPYERRAFPVAKSLDRFIATIESSPKELKYKSNFMVNICENTNMDEAASSLSDDYCISVFTPAMKEQFESNKGLTYPVSYIVVKPEFFPSRVTMSGGPITLNAKRLPTISFLLDAFRQKGIVEIEPVLKSTLEREAPELLHFSYQKPIVLATPTALTDPSITQDRFILLDPAFFQRGRNVINMKELSTRPLIQNAFVRRKVYVMDPKTMYYIRNNLYQYWLANYGSVNTNLYRRLSPQEKLVFCFLQYTKFLEFYSIYRDANETNNNITRGRKIQSAVEKAKKLVFDTDYEGGANPYELASNFTAADQENWRQLIQLQKDEFTSATVQTPKDLQTLLSKLTLRKDAIAETVIPEYFPTPSMQTTETPVNLGAGPSILGQRTRKEKKKQEILQKRAILEDQYKTLVKTRVKSSILPNFLRTRKAKQQNAQLYRSRINAARKQLVNFNQKYGIRSKTSGYGYIF